MSLKYLFLRLQEVDAPPSPPVILRDKRLPESLPLLLRKVDVRLPGKLPWREAGPPNHQDDKVDSDE